METFPRTVQKDTNRIQVALMTTTALIVLGATLGTAGEFPPLS